MSHTSIFLLLLHKVHEFQALLVRELTVTPAFTMIVIIHTNGEMVRTTVFKCHNVIANVLFLVGTNWLMHDAFGLQACINV